MIETYCNFLRPQCFKSTWRLLKTLLEKPFLFYIASLKTGQDSFPISLIVANSSSTLLHRTCFKETTTNFGTEPKSHDAEQKSKTTLNNSIYYSPPESWEKRKSTQDCKEFRQELQDGLGNDFAIPEEYLTCCNKCFPCSKTLERCRTVASACLKCCRT